MDKITNAARRRVKTGGFELAVLDVGEGPAVLLLHGFPSSAMDWRHQVPALVATGYRVVAPDLLGLGKSDKPAGTEHYAAVQDLARTVDLLAALGIERARVVCHDRGAGIGWALAALHPGRVEQLVAMTVGHPNALRDPRVEQRERSWYMLLFQFASAEEQLRRDGWRLFRDLLRHHPETDAWIANLSAEGALTAALGWYRANRHPDAPPRPPLPDVLAPTLGLWAPGDHYLLPDGVIESHRFVRGPWRCERVDGASHFLMLDRPAHVTELILDFFAEQPRRGQDGPIK